MMEKNDTNKPGENESCLKVSDWVAFLSSEKHGMLGNIVNFYVFLAAIIAILIVGGKDSLAIMVGGIIAVAFVGFTYFKFVRPLAQRHKAAERVLEKIMTGELKDVTSISTAWGKELPSFERALRRRRRWHR
jgi:hypothetical protein